MKVYLKNPVIQGAWTWIQNGYKNAWTSLGYDTVYYDSINEIDVNEEYQLMIRDWDVKTQKDLDIIQKSKKTYFFAQPNKFPEPWGSHPNFMTQCSDDVISFLNSLDNVFFWTFGNMSESEKKQHFFKWKNINTIPLAFDNISYVAEYDKDFVYDVCFVGGWANNGFNEKKKIMLDVFSKFQKSNLKCGFFINKNITHSTETKILSSSKVCVNIHDAYQRTLGYDTNERTFKSLGLNGSLVSDKINQINKIFPTVPTSLDSTEIVSLVKKQLQLTEKELYDQKQKNKSDILQNHCYTNRVKKMLQF